MNRYSALIGAALGLYGYPGNQVVFGNEFPGAPQGGPLVMQGGGGGLGFDPALAAQGGYGPGYGPGYGCNPFGQAAYDPGLQALMAKNSIVVGDGCGPAAVDFPLPIGSGQVIAGGTSLTVNATPQMLFTPTALLIPSTIASSLIINDITIGTASQFAAIGPVPAMAFIETATYRGLVWDTCLPNQPIQLQFENITDGDVTLYAMFMGKGARGFGPRIWGQYPR